MKLNPTTSLQKSTTTLPVFSEKSHETSKIACYSLALITLIGSLVANGFLFSHLGYSSLAIGGGGLIVSLVLGFIGRSLGSSEKVISVPKPMNNVPTAPRSINPYERRKAVFQETLRACETGYSLPNGKKVIIDHQKMLANTFSYSKTQKIVPTHTYKTAFTVEVDDTLNVALSLRKQGVNVVALNMANRYHAGGGADSGCPAQEENICYRSNHILGLKTQNYPLAPRGGIYCPHVQVFRKDAAERYAFMDEPQELGLVACAFYDLREESQDRRHLKLSRSFSEDELRKNITYKMGTRRRIRNMLRIMYQSGHRQIVLGAAGCGAFKNHPQVVAEQFKKVFEEPEFKGAFEKVIFAILQISENDHKNVAAFQAACSELSKQSVR